MTRMADISVILMALPASHCIRALRLELLRARSMLFVDSLPMRAMHKISARAGAAASSEDVAYRSTKDLETASRRSGLDW